MTYTFRGYTLPEETRQAINDYVERGYPPGDFLYAVLVNDLQGAIGRADQKNLAGLPAICCYVYNEIPAECHGSRAAIAAWCTRKLEAENRRLREMTK